MYVAKPRVSCDCQLEIGAILGLRIRILQANNGDCFIFNVEELGLCFIVDCGYKITYNQHIKQKINKADFLIATHYDQDHILGALPMLQDTPEKFQLNKIYANTPEVTLSRLSWGPISIRQAISLEFLANESNVPISPLIKGESIKLSDECHLKVLSPREEDLVLYKRSIFNYIEQSKSTATQISSSKNSPLTIDELYKRKDCVPSIVSDLPNATSIAFILTYKNKNLLFLGDSHPEIIADSLEELGYGPSNMLELEYIKLSHHGSEKNISKRLLSIISCSNFIISTNGGSSKCRHPHPETLAKLVKLVDRNGSDTITFLFNYPVNKIENKNGSIMSELDKAKNKVVFLETNEVVIS
jgi:beta-lactamase superfamily II metal-dependent hydrolase